MNIGAVDPSVEAGGVSGLMDDVRAIKTDDVIEVDNDSDLSSYDSVPLSVLKGNNGREEQRHTQDMWMHLIAVGAAAFIGRTNPNASGPLLDIIREVVGKKNENTTSDEESIFTHNVTLFSRNQLDD